MNSTNNNQFIFKYLNQLKENIRKYPFEIKIFLAIFYIVGVVAIYWPQTSGLFMSMTPFALLLSIGFLACFHENTDIKSLRVFSVILITGYLIEVAGVNTGLIFGKYKYGDNLGFKLFNTPLIIGFNWLLITYITSSIADQLKINVHLKVFFASSLMLIYDLILEQQAPRLNYWEWNNAIVPLQNYAAWFGIAVLFQYLIKINKIRTSNALSLTVYLYQLMFFLALIFKQ